MSLEKFCQWFFSSVANPMSEMVEDIGVDIALEWPHECL